MTETDATYRVTLERQPPDVIQAVIVARPEATARLLAYLEERGVRHSGRISGATLAAVCGVKGRTWRRWVCAQKMPKAAARALVAVAFPE